MSAIIRLAACARGALALLLAFVLAPSAGLAAIIITAPTINLPYSASVRSGSFEVYVQSTEANAPLIGADNVELQLPPVPVGVTFMKIPG